MGGGVAAYEEMTKTSMQQQQNKSLPNCSKEKSLLTIHLTPSGPSACAVTPQFANCCELFVSFFCLLRHRRASLAARASNAY